ncbi:hypothetical protein I302_104178 [Kwoniella bestiolae CBS 10118]|uniref:3-hydroxyisobutyrate dehydrogenase n=1 Tax=Kwoniella bestiolae CBS 10118 TaxID=1296100 RepID=A0A1B9GAJ3_9TREE|nr:hypothetical protein I302_02886 [Kwoniella bestiolae CBS 10118]OCF28035.1 hypothetical protein I302_02886 [Kwoniella bestiolae CBS 10118]
MIKPTQIALSRASTTGWIGLGAMGHPMALNLFTKTYLAQNHASSSETPRYVICEQDENRVSSFLSDLRDKGGSELAGKVERVENGKQMAKMASRILTMLPSTPQVESVYLDPQDGILSGIQTLPENEPPPNSARTSQNGTKGMEELSSSTTISPGPSSSAPVIPPLDSSTTISPISTSSPHTLLIDCTTLSPVSAANIAKKIHEATNGKVVMLDAPVSGGVVAARKGELTIMFGAPSDEATQMALPLLQTMAGKDRIVYCGENGKGVGVKVCNNLILAINQIALAEGLALGNSLGIDSVLLHNIINTSSGQSWSSRVNTPLKEIPGSPGERDYEGGFQTRLMLKDASLALESAAALDLPIPMTWAAKSIYEAVCNEPNANWATKDFSVVYEWIKRKQLEGVERGWKADPTET